MTLKPFMWLPGWVVIGCIAAPREVEATLELGAQQVEIDVRLRDIRTSSTDDLTQLRVFNEFAQWTPEWVSGVPWAPTPAKFDYQGDAGRLDLAMHGTMARADFDTCARAASDAGVCKDFPLELRQTGYAVRPEVLASKSLLVDAKMKSFWPADAGRISYRVRLNANDDAFIDHGPSLGRGFELFQSSPKQAAVTLKQIEASEELFVSGSAADWQKDVAGVESCVEPPWCRLRQEAVGREQTRLVYSYLRTQPEAGAGIRVPPKRHIDFLGESLTALLPKDRLTPIDALRLRVRYDVQLADYREQGWLSLGQSAWGSVCRPDAIKKQSLKDFCARLGVKAKR
jgi:hypothetical protein